MTTVLEKYIETTNAQDVHKNGNIRVENKRTLTEAREAPDLQIVTRIRNRD